MPTDLNQHLEPRQTQVTARLAAQGAMLEELRLVLPALRPDTARKDARAAIVRDNILHRDSLGSREKVFTKLSQRYFPTVSPKASANLVRALQNASDSQQFGLLAYTMLLWTDALAFSLGSHWLAPRLDDPAAGYNAADIALALGHLSAEFPEVATWSDSTRSHVAQHYLSLLRDCGFATGVASKTLRRPYIGPDVVHFAVRLLLGGGESPAQLPGHPLFQAMGMTLADVLDTLEELNLRRSLDFATQGGVIRLADRDQEPMP
jgi:hypothetical protein